MQYGLNLWYKVPVPSEAYAQKKGLKCETVIAYNDSQPNTHSHTNLNYPGHAVVDLVESVLNTTGVSVHLDALEPGVSVRLFDDVFDGSHIPARV